jgi:arylsulfatase
VNTKLSPENRTYSEGSAFTGIVGREHSGPTGPFDRWPVGQGFERYYGFLAGETDQWHPSLVEDNHSVDAPNRDDYHLTEDLIDHAIDWITLQKAVSPTKPFFMYLAPGAVHSPHHVPKAYIDRYKGVFDDGWDEIREQTLKQQKKLGVVPANTEQSPMNLGLRAWKDLSDKERQIYSRQMEVFAGFLTHTDEHLGRLFAFLEASGNLANTFILVVSDNGASAEGGPNGLVTEASYFNGVAETIDEMYEKRDEWGGPTTSPHYATGWAWAGNTPQRWYKGFCHEGGTRVPMIVHWPAEIKAKGEVRTQFHHLVDFTPTVLDVLGLSFPETLRGYSQRTLEGAAFVTRLTAQIPRRALPRSTSKSLHIVGSGMRGGSS